MRLPVRPRIGRLYDDHPWTPAGPVVARQHVALAALHVDLEERDLSCAVLVEHIRERPERDHLLPHRAAGSDVALAHLRVCARQAAFITDDIEGRLAPRAP